MLNYLTFTTATHLGGDEFEIKIVDWPITE